MVTAFDLDDGRDPRIALYRPLFEQAATPAPEFAAPEFAAPGISDGTAPESFDWGGWPELLASRIWEPGERGERGAMNFRLDNGFGTVSSALIALPAMDRPDLDPHWHFAPGRPHETGWTPVDLS